MPRNSQVGPLAMPCTLPVAVSVTWKILLEPPPAANPAGGRAGGEGAWALARPTVAAVAASAAPAIRTVLRLDCDRSLDMRPPSEPAFLGGVNRPLRPG